MLNSVASAAERRYSGRYPLAEWRATALPLVQVCGWVGARLDGGSWSRKWVRRDWVRNADKVPSSWRFPSRLASSTASSAWSRLSCVKSHQFGGWYFGVGSASFCEEISLTWVRVFLGRKSFLFPSSRFICLISSMFQSSLGVCELAGRF